MRLIDADFLEPYYRLMQDNATGMKMMALPDGIVDQQPTVDAVPVIRCKDCVNCRKSTLAGRTWKHCAFIGNVVYEDNYCCWAERKEV